MGTGPLPAGSSGVSGSHDGLTPNFGLVARMIGAQGGMKTASHAVGVASLGQWPTR